MELSMEIQFCIICKYIRKSLSKFKSSTTNVLEMQNKLFLALCRILKQILQKLKFALTSNIGLVVIVFHSKARCSKPKIFLFWFILYLFFILQVDNVLTKEQLCIILNCTRWESLTSGGLKMYHAFLT